MTCPAKSRMANRQPREAGVAAIEFALVLPVLLLLFFGLVNITHFAAMARKVRVAAELMSDLVARPDPVVQKNLTSPSPPKENSIYATSVDDYFKAVELSFRPLDAAWVRANVGIDVYNFPQAGGTGSPARTGWTRFYRGSATCTVPSASSPRVTASIADSDVLVVVVCMNYTAPAAQIPGFQSLVSKKIEEVFYNRPRQYNTLDLNP